MSEKEIKKDEKEEVIKNKDSGIGYSGNVKVSIVKNKKIISKVTGHNTGGLPLFKFLAYCLAGNYKSAEELRPMKIKLFNNSGKSIADAITNINNWGTASENKNAIVAASDFIYVNTSDYVEAGNIETKTSSGTVTEPKATTVLHFRIPFSFLTANSINQLCIYGKNENSKDSSYCAYYLLQDEKGNLSSITVDNQSSYNLIVEWELNIANRTAPETSTSTSSGGTKK